MYVCAVCGDMIRTSGFEVRELLYFGRLFGQPLGHFSLIDSAITCATDASRRAHSDIFVVRDMCKLGDKPRGVAIGCRWMWAVNCRRCRGEESNRCGACRGAGYNITETP